MTREEAKEIVIAKVMELTETERNVFRDRLTRIMIDHYVPVTHYHTLGCAILKAIDEYYDKENRNA